MPGGEFLGYSNGPTMQVGLWIVNDGDEFRAGAAYAAARQGAEVLAAYLTRRMNRAVQGTSPHAVRRVLSEQMIEEEINWPEIAESIIRQRDES